jgi:hypothetical protein
MEVEKSKKLNGFQCQVTRELLCGAVGTKKYTTLCSGYAQDI